MISQKSMHPGLPNLTYKCSTTTLLWGQKVKDQGQNVCVSLQTEHTIAAAVYMNHGFFHAVMPRHTNKGSDDTGFSLHHFPASADHWTLGFPQPGFLHSCECRLLLVMTVAIAVMATVTCHRLGILVEDRIHRRSMSYTASTVQYGMVLGRQHC